MRNTTKNGRVMQLMRTRYISTQHIHILCCASLWLTTSQLLDELEPLASAGGVILDWHTSDIFPERWVDLVVVLRCDHTQLWERLEQR